MNIRQCRGSICLANRASPTSCPFRKPYSLPRGCSCPRPIVAFGRRCQSTPNQCAWNAVRARRTLPHGQRPTDLHIRVAFVLARWQDASPSHAKLARAAHCHRNSVLTALHRLRELGLLSWERQFARLRGGYVAQVANRYLFPSGSCLPAARTTREGKGRRSSALLAPRSLCTGGRPLLPVRSVAEQLQLLGVG